LPNSSGSTQVTPASTSAYDYSVGLFQIATVGQQAACTIGRLYVGYSCLLEGPRLNPGSTILPMHYSGLLPVTANNFAGLALQSGGGSIPIVVTSNVLTFPAGYPGNYMVLVVLYGSTSVTAPTGFTPSAGATSVNYFTLSTRDANANATSAASTSVTFALSADTVTIAASGGVLTWNACTLVGGAGCDVWVIQIPPNLLTTTFINPFSKMLYDMQAQLASFETRLSVQTDGDEKESEWSPVDPNQNCVSSCDKTLLSKFALPPITVPTAFRTSPSSKVK
jgi:hypothetical protein